MTTFPFLNGKSKYSPLTLVKATHVARFSPVDFYSIPHPSKPVIRDARDWIRGSVLSALPCRSFATRIIYKYP